MIVLDFSGVAKGACVTFRGFMRDEGNDKTTVLTRKLIGIASQALLRKIMLVDFSGVAKEAGVILLDGSAWTGKC